MCWVEGQGQDVACDQLLVRHGILPYGGAGSHMTVVSGVEPLIRGKQADIKKKKKKEVPFPLK